MSTRDGLTSVCCWSEASQERDREGLRLSGETEQKRGETCPHPCNFALTSVILSQFGGGDDAQS